MAAGSCSSARSAGPPASSARTTWSPTRRWLEPRRCSTGWVTMPPQSSATEAAPPSLGAAFAHAVAGGDFAKLAELLQPDVDFRALTPRRAWEAATREEALEVLR